MKEILVKLNVPDKLEDKFELALNKVIEQFTRRLRFSLIEDITSKSKLTDEQTEELAREFKENFSKRHKLE